MQYCFEGSSQNLGNLTIIQKEKISEFTEEILSESIFQISSYIARASSEIEFNSLVIDFDSNSYEMCFSGDKIDFFIQITPLITKTIMTILFVLTLHIMFNSWR